MHYRYSVFADKAADNIKTTHLKIYCRIIWSVAVTNRVSNYILFTHVRNAWTQAPDSCDCDRSQLRSFILGIKIAITDYFHQPSLPHFQSHCRLKTHLFYKSSHFIQCLLPQCISPSNTRIPTGTCLLDGFCFWFVFIIFLLLVGLKHDGTDGTAIQLLVEQTGQTDSLYRRDSYAVD